MWGDDVFQRGEAGEVEIAGSRMRQFEVHEVADVADSYIDEQESSKLDFLRYYSEFLGESKL